jgi:hypothetical protein
MCNTIPLPLKVMEELVHLLVAVDEAAAGNVTHSVLLLQVVHDSVAARAKLLQQPPEQPKTPEQRR